MLSCLLQLPQMDSSLINGYKVGCQQAKQRPYRLCYIYYLQQLDRHASLVNKVVYFLSEQGLAETLRMLKFSFAGG